MEEKFCTRGKVVELRKALRREKARTTSLRIDHGNLMQMLDDEKIRSKDLADELAKERATHSKTYERLQEVLSLLDEDSACEEECENLPEREELLSILESDRDCIKKHFCIGPEEVEIFDTGLALRIDIAAHNSRGYDDVTVVGNEFPYRKNEPPLEEGELVYCSNCDGGEWMLNNVDEMVVCEMDGTEIGRFSIYIEFSPSFSATRKRKEEKCD